MNVNELLAEIQLLKDELNSLRNRRLELNSKIKTRRLDLYKEYLRGLIPVAWSTLNAMKVSKLEQYRKSNQISEDEHITTLNSLGYSMMSFDALRAYTGEQEPPGDECVVCYEPPRDHMIIPCNHVILCSECAEELFDFWSMANNYDLLRLVHGFITAISVNKDNDHIPVDLISVIITFLKPDCQVKCPLCSHNVKKVVQVYF
eukprot:225162_1